MEQRKENKNYRAIGEKLIDEMKELFYIKESQVRIIYLESDQLKTSGRKVVHGECEKVPAKYKWAIPADFTITLYRNNNIGFTQEQMEILIFHELLHVGIERKIDGTEIYSNDPHDLEDFKLVIDKYGTDWAMPKISR